jgi:hypothetical protein
MSYFQGAGQNDASPEPELDMWLVDEVLGMTQGYVLDFSDKTFNDFVRRTFGIDVTAPTYTVGGTSKAKRMRAFLRALVPGAQAEVLRKFWAHRQRSSAAFPTLEPRVESAFFEMVAQLEGGNQPIDLGVVEKFNDDETLSELVDAIEREIQANSPHAALDRLHTYTMKKFAELLKADGIEVSPKDSCTAERGVTSTAFDAPVRSVRFPTKSPSRLPRSSNGSMTCEITAVWRTTTSSWVAPKVATCLRQS